MTAPAWKWMPVVPALEMLEAWQQAVMKNPYCVGRNHVHADGRQWEFCERTDYETRPDADDFTLLERFATEDEAMAHRDLVVLNYAYQAKMNATPTAPAL